MSVRQGDVQDSALGYEGQRQQDLAISQIDSDHMVGI